MLTLARSLALLAGLLAIAGAGVFANGATLTVTRIGGLDGTRYVEKQPDSTYEPTELVAIDFSARVALDSLKSATSITPREPFSAIELSYGNQVRIRFRKTAGVTYQIHIAAGVRTVEGGVSTAPVDITVRTSDEPIPAPLRAAPNEPYRYGILAHPSPISLGGPNAEKIIDEFVGAGVRFVRIDYCGDQIEAAEGQHNWSVQDRIASMLAAKGITELPIVDQYCAPKWATGGFAYPAIWQTPALYAAFAAAVAEHVAQNYRAITRIELFNEPNLKGWWTNEGDPEYAATDGTAAAKYMLAAYAAVKRVAPGLTVVGPALANGGPELDPRTYFTTLYASGCRRGECWDVISVHNYRWANPTFPSAPDQTDRFDIYKALQDIAARHGDPGTHVMLTEWGYSTIDEPDGVDPKTQARYVALGLNEMLADPTVDGIVYVNMYFPRADLWGQTALVTPDFVPKPAYYVYRAFATR